MKKNISSLLTLQASEDGYFHVSEDNFYEDKAELLATELFGFCGCAIPEKSLKHIRDGLDFVVWKGNVYGQPPEEGKTHWEMIVKKANEVFGNENSYAFFLYWADKEELTEHGGSVNGCWLSDDGKILLEGLKKLDLEN